MTADMHGLEHAARLSMGNFEAAPPDSPLVASSSRRLLSVSTAAAALAALAVLAIAAVLLG